MTSTDLKDQGNKFFALRKYNDAVACYSKAIVSHWSLIRERQMCHCYLLTLLSLVLVSVSVTQVSDSTGVGA